MLNDLKFALRTLTRTPIITFIAILSLALGIGANTAIFSILDKILLQGLPVPEQGQLVNFIANGPRSGSNSSNQAGNTNAIFSAPMFRDLESKQTVFTGIAAHRLTGANVAYQKQTFAAQILEVSGSYFPVLGLTPFRGRLISFQDDQKRGGHPVVVLSHEAWKKRFGADESILNQAILVNGVPLTVVGIAPEGFSGTTLGTLPEIFFPMQMDEVVVPGRKWLDNRRAYWIYLFARLKPGVTVDQAQSGIDSLFRGIINEVDAPLQKGASENFMKRFRDQHLTLTPGYRGQSNIHKDASTPLYMLLGITGFVLLIACANIANLLLAKAANRGREMSIRLSVGAARGQLIRQLLTEAFLIAFAGGLLGLFFTYVTTEALIAFLPADSRLKLTSETTDWRALAFAFAVTILTGFLFGLFPAIHSTRQDLVSALKDQAGNVSASGLAALFRKSLVVAQIALSLLLLISAGLFIRSLVNVSRVELGIRTENVIGFSISPELNKYTPEQSRQLFERLEENLAAIPGVTSSTASLVSLIANNNWGTNVSVDGFAAGPDTDTHSMYNEVGASFFKTLGIPLIAGREFTPADHATAPKVAIVNERFVKKFSASSNVVGKKMQIGSGGKNEIEIVGVAKDAKYSDVKDETPSLFFLPYRQDKQLGSSHFYVRTSLPAEQVIASIRRTVAALDPNLPVEEIKTMETQVRENTFMDRMISSLSTAFAALATLLAAIGLYGVLAFSVARRTREIGIRLAIGAETSKVRNMVMREVVLMIAIGSVIAIPAAIGLARYAETLLFGLKGNDPIVIVGATIVVALVSLAAGYFPALKATRVDPLTALRYE